MVPRSSSRIMSVHMSGQAYWRSLAMGLSILAKWFSATARPLLHTDTGEYVTRTTSHTLVHKVWLVSPVLSLLNLRTWNVLLWGSFIH